jgi:hypothetical protein
MNSITEMGVLFLEALGEVPPFEHLGHGHLRCQLEDFAHVEGGEPLGVVPDLERLRQQHPAELGEDGLGIPHHLATGEPLARFAPPGGITDLGGEVTDDQHGHVAEFLEVPELAKHHRPSERHRRSGGVQPEFDAEGPPGCELVGQGLGRLDHVDTAHEQLEM